MSPASSFLVICPYCCPGVLGKNTIHDICGDRILVTVLLERYWRKTLYSKLRGPYR
jgi:hypothetical protein